jgi:predicted mannosyl-3-phosphoglycerate phosphatase (HAD superfamily)
MFREECGNQTMVGIGDSWNDVPLLSAVHVPLLVKRPGGFWEDIRVKGLRRIDAIGPLGWTRAMEKLVAGEF